ncbi:hypothetical protein MMC22_009322 [Lobaria immixta]|nr:hypothetical protein [Lobaria immixta]
MNRETVPPDYSQSESAVNQAHREGDVDDAPGTSMDKPSPSGALGWQDRPSSAPVVGATGVSQFSSPPRDSKARQNLQLPPFRSLGIVVPHPDFLLTPPYETDIKWNASFQDPSEISSSTQILRPTSVTSEGTTPQTPHVHEFISKSTNNTPTPTQAPEQGTMSEEAGQDENNIERPSWLEQAVESALSTIASNDSAPHVLNVFSHSQPCPLSDESIPTPSVFAPVIAALQAKFEMIPGRYIEVTHAVPVKFNMAWLLTSPVGTPNMSSSGGSVDYFNMTVFSKAVVAVDHHDASNSPVPSSPHPVVAPASVGLALLERFIPPTTLQEYLDLFTPDCPSVLVNRLVELSPDNGSLIFIYPTAQGAASFATRYLGPLLDPLLRTMVGIHELTADLGANVGKMAVVEHMVAFEKMAQKIKQLLRHMNRGSQRGGPSPKYALVQSSRQIVEVERKAWTEWWMHQETPRIRDVMNRYFQRAVKLPLSKEITAGSLVREILLGVENRAYAEYDAPREGIEIGVFVVRRTG